MVVLFSPKILGLNTRNFRTVFGQFETDFQFGCAVFMCVDKKMNNMLVV